MNVARRSILFLLASLSALAIGCSSGSEASQKSSDQGDRAEKAALIQAACNAEEVEHACSHAINGPFRTVNATALSAPPTQNVNAPHTAWTVNLVQVNGNYEGTVSYTPAETGDFALFLGNNIPVKVFNGATEVGIESTCDISSTECAKLTKGHIVPLTGGTTYRLNFGPVAGVSSVLLIVEESGHH